MIDARHEELLQRALDGATTPEEAAELQQALAADAELRARRDELAAVAQFLAGAAPVPPPADLRDSIVKQVRSLPRFEPAAGRWTSWRDFAARLRPGYGYAFAAGIALALAVSWLPGWHPGRMAPDGIPGTMLPGPVSRTLRLADATATVRLQSDAGRSVVLMDLQALQDVEVELEFAPEGRLVVFERGPGSPGTVTAREGGVAFRHRGRDRVRIVLAGPPGEIRVSMAAGGDKTEAVFEARP